MLLGTIVEITVTDKEKPQQAKADAIKQAFAEIARVENMLSRFKPDSDVSRINSFAQHEPIKVTPETIRLIEKSNEFSQLTNGAFDVTIQPLTEIWGLATKYREDPPKASQITKALNRVGYQNVKVVKNEQSVAFTQPGMSIDLGGIAKGYAVDMAIQVLKKEGIRNALVNAGGDIYCLGQPNQDNKWQIAVQHPRDKNSTLTIIELRDKAIATSGDYQNYIQIKGKRYSHIINPKSGQPCTEVPASVTVLSADCLTADALATSIYVLGPEKGMNLINQLENTEAIIVSFQKGKLGVRVSAGLQQKRLQLSACIR
ncbi:MAG: FAD:protein FMN transferase [Candidatus Omnitrophica bacterium]|nr:FAD:protein FMN transferase [Candidatus Omnitrophota bacterium]